MEGRVGGLTEVSGSDLCRTVIHHDYTGPIAAVGLLLPTLRFLYLHFDTFSSTLDSEKQGLWMGFLRF